MTHAADGGDAYAAAGVDTARAGRAIDGLVDVLRAIDPGRASRSVLASGHYAAVLEVAPNLGIALGTDSVGSKVILAQQMERFDTIGIDCVAMNVNDLICVGATPLALVDYLAVEDADPELLRDLAIGLRAGAEAAGIEIPGGEVCQLREVIRGHPSPLGFDLVGSSFGTVALDAIVTGERLAPGDALVGLPSSGLHSNGYTLARRVLLAEAGMALDDAPPQLGGATLGEALLEPTVIYVRAVLELLEAGVAVHGLWHITGDGVLNLLRLGSGVGYEIDRPLPVPPVFGLVADAGGLPTGQLWQVFNMGCGFVVAVAEESEPEALALLERHHPGAARIGTVTNEGGQVAVPPAGLRGDETGLHDA